MNNHNVSIVPFEMKYLEDYYKGFNSEIAKYQWPDPFESIDAAKELLQEFLDEMEKGETLLFSVLTDDERFVGSVEMHGLMGDCPELGVWTLETEQGKGFGYKALKMILDHAYLTHQKTEFYYEADLRNEGSTKLLHKLETDYEVTKAGLEEVTTDSGKDLQLQGYVLKRII